MGYSDELFAGLLQVDWNLPDQSLLDAIEHHAQSVAKHFCSGRTRVSALHPSERESVDDLIARDTDFRPPFIVELEASVSTDGPQRIDDDHTRTDALRPFSPTILLP